MSKVSFLVAPQVSNGDIRVQLIDDPMSAIVRANEILKETYKPAVITELTIENNEIVSKRIVTLQITAVEVTE